MVWPKAETMKRVSNVRAKAVAKAPARREVAIVIRLKGGKYSTTNEPFGECILYNVD